MMAFIKKRNDLKGIFTLMVLILPSIAANIDCNGKPFHCVNSTHFMICVDLGSGVSSTIDDFVIPCPPTTVCQGTNRFECEFPAVTTTTHRPSAVPFVTSVSETMGIVSTPLYELTTSIPFEEYFNTLSTTTLSQDALIAHQAIVTESTIQLVTEVTQNIEVVIPVSESNSTLNETISSVNVVQNILTTHTPLLDSISASSTDLISDVTENVSLMPETDLILNETIPSVAAARNNLTVTTNSPFTDATQNIEMITLRFESNSTSNESNSSVNVVRDFITTPFLDNISASSKDLIVDVIENVSVMSRSETELSLNETVPSVAVERNNLTVTTITPSTDATQNIETITPSNETISSVNVVHNVLTIPFLDNISASIKDLIVDVTENVSVMSRSETELILNETIPSVAVVRNNLTVTTITPTDATQNIETVTPSNETITSVNVVHNVLRTPLLDNISASTTYLIPDVTENVSGMSRSETDLILNQTIPSEAVVRNDLTATTIAPLTDATQNIEVVPPSNETFSSVNVVHNRTTTPLLDNISASTTDLNLDFTEQVSVISRSETDMILNETIPSVVVVRNELTATTIASLTDATQNIEVGPPSNETFSSVNVIHNRTTTSLLDNISASTTDLNLDFTEQVSVMSRSETDMILNEAIPSVVVVRNNFTATIIAPLADATPNKEVVTPSNETFSSVNFLHNRTTTPLLDNISASTPNLNLDVTEHVSLMSRSETNLILNDTIPSVAVVRNNLTVTTIKPFTDATQNIEMMTPSLETISSVNVAHNRTTTPLLDNISASTTYLMPDDRENVSVMSRSENDMILNEAIPSVAVVRNDFTVITIAPSTKATQNKEELTLRSESTSSLNETISSAIVVHNTTTLLLDNIIASTTYLIPDVTESVSVMPRLETDLILNETNARVAVIRNDQIVTTIAPLSGSTTASGTDLIADITESKSNATGITNNKNDNATDLIPDTTENVNVFISEANPIITAIQRPTNVVRNDTAPIYTLSSNYMTNNLADTVTKSISTEVAENTPSVAHNFIHNNLTTLNKQSNTTLPDKIVDISVTERILNELTDNMNVNKSEPYITVVESNLFTAVDFEQINLSKITTLNSTTSPNNLVQTATEPVIITNMVKPEFNSTLVETLPSKPEDLIQNYHTTQKYLSNTSLPSDIATTATVSGVTENINETIAESHFTLNEYTSNVPVATDVIENNFTSLKITNITLPSSITAKPIVIAMTLNSNLTTESINKTLTDSVTTVTVDIIPYYNGKTPSSNSTAWLNITDDATALDTNNANYTETEFILTQTSSESGSLLSKNLKNVLDDIAPVYSQSTTAMPNITEPVLTDNVLVNTLNEINKTNTTGYKNYNVTSRKNTTDHIFMNSSENYQGSLMVSIAMNSSNTFDFIETTSNYILETPVVSAQEEITSSNVYYYTDTENIRNDQEILTSQTNNISALSEKILLTSALEHRATTPTFTVINSENIFTSSSISNTDAPLLSPPEVTSIVNTDKLPFNNKPVLSITNQPFKIQEDTPNKINSNELSVLTSDSNGTNTFQIVNVSRTQLPVNSTSLQTGQSTDNIVVRPALNNNHLFTTNSPVHSLTSPNITITVKLPVMTESADEIITAERTTLATTSAVTETSQAFYSDTSNVTSASKISITESAVSQEILTSPSNEAVTIASISKTILDSSNRLSLNQSINLDQQSNQKIMHIDVESMHTTNGSNQINQELPTAEISTENTTAAKPAIKENMNIGHSPKKSISHIMKEEVLLQSVNIETMQTESSVPILHPTKVVIATEPDNSYLEAPLNIESVNNKTGNTSDLTQKTLSSLLIDNVQSEIFTVADNISNITNNTPDVGDPGFDITHSLNAGQQEIFKKIALELVTSSTQTELPVPSPNKIKSSVTITPESITGFLGNTLNTSIIASEYSATSVTEPFSPENQIDFTAANGDVNVLIENTLSTVSINVETAKENSPTKQIPYNKEPSVTTTNILMESKPIQGKTVKTIFTNILAASGDLSKSSKDNVTLKGATLQELTKNGMDANLRMSTSNETVSYGSIHTVEKTVAETNASTPSVSDAHEVLIHEILDIYTELDIETSQILQEAGIQKSKQTSVDDVDNQSPYQQNIETDIQQTITSQQQHTPTASYNSARTLQPKQATVLDRAFTTDNLNNKQIHELVNNQSNSINEIGKAQLAVHNKSVTGNPENEATIINENVKLSKHVTNTETSFTYVLDKLGQNTIAVNSKTPQGIGFGSQTKITNNHPVTLNEDNITSILNKGSSDTLVTESITEPWRATVVTESYVQITSQFITKQPIIEVPSTEPYKKLPKTSNNTTHTANRPNVNYIVSNPETQFINVSSNTTFINKKAAINVISTTATESSNKIPQTSEMTVQMPIKPDLNRIALQEDLINNSKNKTDDQTGEQVITPNLLGSNYNVDVVMANVVNTNDQVLLENNLQARTYSGISVIPIPTKQPNVDQYEQFKGKIGRVKKITSEAPETNDDVSNNFTPVIDTTVSTVSDSKDFTPDPDPNNEQNVILTGTPQTVDSRLSFTSKKNPLETTIEITNVKFTENFVQGMAASVVTFEPEEKTNKNESIMTAHIASNAISNIKSSTAYSTHLEKTHNASFPAFEAVKNSHNFVCKSNRRGRYSDSNDCRKFYICIGRQDPIEGFCPNNTVFSELRKQCTRNLSHCVRNNQFQCVYEGRFSDYFNDNIYYICVKNNAGTFIRFTLQCESGYYLNKTSVRCALNTESIQSTSQQSMSDISKNISDQSMPRAKSEKLVVETSKKLECEDEGKFPDTNNCRKYYICTKIGKSRYRLRIKKCDSDELFHKDKKKCVDADSYECS